MGSTAMKAFLAAGIAAVVVASGVGFILGRSSGDTMELGSSGTASGEGSASVQEKPDPSGNGGESTPGWRTNEVRIGRQDAESAALDRIRNSRVLHGELEEENGYFLWEVLLQRADGSYVEVFVDAADGRVLGIDHEGLDD